MRFKELEVWKRSFNVSLYINKQMRACKDFGFKDQICRSSVSVPSNIAEGSERGSNKDNIRFLFYAKGSCAELLTQVLLAKEFGYLPKDEVNKLIIELEEINKMLAGYINDLNRSRD
ncbi:four helix bundle protein [Aliivibrio logei]|uniref:Four helix bundle protein n=1 Tax=Aliivibrio logei 5S-186 TaxID=626086 RepID=A0ABX3AQ06_ALILO|nr:four helix bundle protein [Aliivibrio logei]OEF09476.1 four helix bundle protein [Aliivibrio logei 5S-186]